MTYSSAKNYRPGSRDESTVEIHPAGTRERLAALEAERDAIIRLLRIDGLVDLPGGVSFVMDALKDAAETAAVREAERDDLQAENAELRAALRAIEEHVLFVMRLQPKGEQWKWNQIRRMALNAFLKSAPEATPTLAPNQEGPSDGTL